MIITCNDCDTKFMVKAEAFGENPRRVRCGSCSHVWMQKPLTEEAVKQENKVIEDQKENLAAAVKAQAEGVKPSLPVVAVKIVPKWMKTAVICLVVLNAVTFVALNKQMIGQTGFYTMLGDYDTSAFTISDPVITNADGDDKNLYLSWDVHNAAKSKQTIPGRRVRLFDKNLNVIDKAIDNRPMTVEAGQNYGFKQNKISNKGKYLVLDIGNPYEFKFR